MIWLVLAVLFFLVFEGFFSGSEIAIVSANRAFLYHRAREGSKSARVMLGMLDRPEMIISTTLLGTNISLVCSNFAANELCARLAGVNLSWVSLVFMIPLTLFFGEILPKAYFRRYSDMLAYKIVKPLKVISIIFAPFTIILRIISGWIRRIALGKNRPSAPKLTRDEFKILIESHRLAPKEDTIHRMLNNLSSYMGKTVGDIAVPMINVSRCGPDDRYLKIVDTFIRSRFSRIPVYDREKDEVTGIINDLQLLDRKNRNKTAGKMAEKTICIPENLDLGRALILMRKEYKEMASVIDEYGGTAGIVTLKDIIAEITGKLSDRYETDDQGYFHSVSSNVFIVDALFRLDELEGKVGVNFGNVQFETTGGLLNHLLGRIPRKDDECRYKNLTFKVLRSRPQKAEMVRVTVEKQKE
jgi:CBS domain containing-hemolysin-like protein